MGSKSSGRLMDAMERQRRVDKRAKRAKRQQKRLEQRAQMLRDAVTPDGLREQIRVLEKLGKQQHGKKVSSAATGKKGDRPNALGGLDALQFKRLEELRDRLAILQDEATGSEDDDDEADTDSNASSPTGSEGHGAPPPVSSSGVAVMVDDDGADAGWAAFFDETDAAGQDVNQRDTKQQQQQRIGGSGGGRAEVFGVAIAATTTAKPPPSAASATTASGSVSIARGGTALSFVPKAAALRAKAPGASSGRSAQPSQPTTSSGAEDIAHRVTVQAAASRRFNVADPLALAKAPAPPQPPDRTEVSSSSVVPGMTHEDDLDGLFDEFDAAGS